MTPRILVIAGSDSGGGAGIQADIKTITMLGGHAMTAITAITAQNTVGVSAIEVLSPGLVMSQVIDVLDDMGADAVKVGMLGSAANADWMVDYYGWRRLPIVLDPVMVASSGATLADDAGVEALQRIARQATIVTPNLPELAVLCGKEAIHPDWIDEEAALYARSIGAAVLVKGGHADGETVVDRLFDAEGELVERWEAPRIDTVHTHGTGCTLSSAIATGLARGLSLAEAVKRARTFVRLALKAAPGLGRGHGPMGHQRVRLDIDLDGAMPNQITLPATDHAASLAFYRTLGLTPIVDSDNRYARFESAGGATLSIEAADEIDGCPVVFLEVADLEGAVARLRAAGISVADPVMQPWLWREARLFDPAGNALCLYQAGEMRRFPPWRLPNA